MAGTHAHLAAPQRLAAAIRSRRAEIIQRWTKAVCALPRARDLDRPRLVDHVPQLLDRIAQMIEDLGDDPLPSMTKEICEQHALARLEQGFDVREIMSEFGVLRDVLFAVLDDPQIGPLRIDEVRVVNRAIDRAVRDSVDQYEQIRERTLEGFDRISAAVIESSNLDDLLRRLLQVLHDTTPSVDTSAIYLRDGDVVRLRAAVGAGRNSEEGLAMPVGDGFAGQIVATGQPLTLHHPRADQVRSPALARMSLRVLFGVPIVEAGSVIGVATVGSTQSNEFSPQDQRLFTAMVARATAAIVQHVLRDQAQQAAAQIAARDRELRILADNIPQLAWMADAQGTIYWYNQRWYDFTGLTFEELSKRGWETVHHPDHLGRVVEKWQRALATGARWEDTFPMRGRDGRFRWFLSRAVPIRDANGKIDRWFGTNTDVTARRFLDRATTLLNRSLEYDQTLEQLARFVVPDLADFCVVEALADGRRQNVALAHSNEAKLDLAREYVRRYPLGVVQSGQSRVIADITDEMLAASAQDAEHLRLLRELEVRSWIGVPLVARGEVRGVVHLIMSESNRHYSDADVELATELGARAGAAIENAQLHKVVHDAVRSREDVLAIVSHDLRNPLGAVELAAALLQQQTGLDARGRKHVETIRRSSSRMESLINDLLDMASINVGKLTIHPQPVDAAELLNEVLDIHEPIANERGITLARESEHLDAPLLVDRNRMIQAFGNLLGNAIKFCAPGDVIRVTGARIGERVRFSIADSGPGIPAAELPHIFEPYWRGQNGRKKGTGLGLFITKAIIEAHGGQITVATAEGRGSTFTVEVPISSEEQGS